MGLGGQLRDKARIIRVEKSNVRVEGEYKTSTVIGPWFRCFYDPGGESEERQLFGIRRRHSGAQLITGRRATDGSEIELKAQDRVEINSRGHGVLSLDVTGKPERLVKGRTRLGWLADLGKTNREAAG